MILTSRFFALITSSQLTNATMSAWMPEAVSLPSRYSSSSGSMYSTGQPRAELYISGRKMPARRHDFHSALSRIATHGMRPPQPRSARVAYICSYRFTVRTRNLRANFSAIGNRSNERSSSY